MNKIVIIENSGTGKSTVSHILSSKLSIPVIHLDQMYHQTNWPQSESEKQQLWAEKLGSIWKSESWIIDCAYPRTTDLIFLKADTIIFFRFQKIFNILELSSVLSQN